MTSSFSLSSSPSSSSTSSCPTSTLSSHAARAWHWYRTVLGAPRHVCAPMVRETDGAFRLLVRSWGCELCYSPMLHAERLSSCPASDDLAELDNIRASVAAGDRPLLAQFCATQPQEFLAAAQMIQDHVDGVDLNLGCPQPTAQEGGFGAFLMDKPEVVRSIIHTAASTLSIPVTAKIRLLPDLDQTVAFARMLQEAGCSLLCVHGRLRAQRRYQDKPNWDAMRAIVQALDIPVIVNGGIEDMATVDEILPYTGAAGAMIATAILFDPRVFTRPATPLSPAQAADIFEHYLRTAAGLPVLTFRYVQSHAKSILGAWLSQHQDLKHLMTVHSRICTLPQMHCLLQVLRHRLGLLQSGQEDEVPQMDIVGNSVEPWQMTFDEGMGVPSKEEGGGSGSICRGNSSTTSSKTANLDKMAKVWVYDQRQPVLTLREILRMDPVRR